jgi:hypothetical protein
MKLAEFFISLGFDTSGSPELKKLEQGLNELAGNAAKLLAMFGSVTAAMGVMLNQALKTSDGFRRFSAVTGLSTDELKKWQYAAKLAGVEAEEVASAIQTLQEARANIAMGTGNVAPWQLLGIAPSDNPFDTLRQLKERIKGLDPAIARSIAGQMGISEGVFAMLRLSNREFDELESKYQLTKQNQQNLTAVSRAWAELTFKLSAARDTIVAALVPAFTPLLRVLTNIIGLLGSFSAWLSKGTIGAKIMRVVLTLLAGAVVAVTVALTVLLGVIGLVTAAIAALELVAAPILPIIAAISAIILIAVGAVAALILVIQDLWVAVQGGDSFFVDVFTKIGGSINDAIQKLLEFLGIWNTVKDAFTWLHQKATGGTILSDDEIKKLDEVNRKFREMRAGITVDPAASLSSAALAPSTTNTNSSSVRQENKVDIHVEGGKDPYTTGQRISESLDKVLSNAARQIPVPA